MKTKFFVSLSIVAVCVIAPGAPTASQSQSEQLHPSQNPKIEAPLRVTPELVNQFAVEMAGRHPALLAARARTNAAAANVKSVRTWDDPMAKVGGMAAERMMRMEDGDFSYGLEQKLPLFGKPGAMRKMAAAELAVAQAEEDLKFQNYRSLLAKALFGAALADENLAIASEDLAWLQLTAKVVEEGYRSGAGRLMDVLTVQNEQSKREAQLKTEREAREQAIRVVNRFLHRDLDHPWPTLQLPPLAGPVLFSPKLLGYALAQAPELKKMRREVRMMEASVNVARKERWPEVTIGFENRTYARENDLRSTEVMLGFSIPLGNSSKYRAAIRREDEKRQAAEFEAQNAAGAVSEEIHGLIVKIAAMRREALLYREQIIPRSEQAFASAKGMFESGGPLRDVLDARRMLIEGKSMYVRAVAEQYEMLSELILCCGLGDLEALEMIGAVPESELENTKP